MAKQVTLKERLSALNNLPPFFKLVWQTHPGLTAVNFLLRIIRAATPLAILYVAKLVIDQIIFLSHGNHDASYPHLWKLVAIEFGLAVLSDSLGVGSPGTELEFAL